MVEPSPNVVEAGSIQGWSRSEGGFEAALPRALAQRGTVRNPSFPSSAGARLPAGSPLRISPVICLAGAAQKGGKSCIRTRREIRDVYSSVDRRGHEFRSVPGSVRRSIWRSIRRRFAADPESVRILLVQEARHATTQRGQRPRYTAPLYERVGNWNTGRRRELPEDAALGPAALRTGVSLHESERTCMRRRGETRSWLPWHSQTSSAPKKQLPVCLNCHLIRKSQTKLIFKKYEIDP